MSGRHEPRIPVDQLHQCDYHSGHLYCCLKPGHKGWHHVCPPGTNTVTHYVVDNVMLLRDGYQ